MTAIENQFLNVRDLVIEFRNKSKKFQAVKGVSFDIEKGEIFGLVGESGSGKTTIGRAIVGVQPIKDGTVFLEGQVIAGKPTNLFTLNKEIYQSLKNIDVKTKIATSYLNNFLNNLKKSYDQYENDKQSFSYEKIALILKKSNIGFVDSVILKNLKYVNKIIKYFDRINQFINKIHEYIPSIPKKLEQAIFEKNSSTKKEFFKAKDFLDEMYKAIVAIKNRISKFKKSKSDDFEKLIKNTFKDLKVVVNSQRQLLLVLPIINNLEFQNLVLSAPLNKREKYKAYYYKKVYVPRDEFHNECNKQLNQLQLDPKTNKKLIEKYEGYLKNFWSKDNMNIKICEKIIKNLQANPNDNNKNLLLIDSLKLTNFELHLKKIVTTNQQLNQKQLESLEKEFLEIKKIINENIVKSDELVFEYYKWKNYKKDYDLESRESIIELIEFLNFPSIDKLVKESKIYQQHSKDINKNNRKNVQMIFQDPSSSLNDRMAIEEIISEGLENFKDLYSSYDAKLEYVNYHNNIHPEDKLSIEDVKPVDVKKYIVLKLITSVGLLPEHLSRYPHEFSGGQRQRVGIARSLAMKPKIIVADEPISALDVSIRAQVLNLFKKFKDEYDLTYLFITHDLSVVRFIADRIAVIYHGQIVELAAAEELFKNPLHPYTKSLLSAVPVPQPELAKKKELIVYDPETEHHDYIFDVPDFIEITPGHFIHANKREIEEFKNKINK